MGQMICSAGEPSRLAKAATTVEDAFLQNKLKVKHYCENLLIEALIRYNLFTKDSAGVAKAVARAQEKSWCQIDPKGKKIKRCDFSYLPYWVYRATDDQRWVEKILDENQSYEKSRGKSPEGGVRLHHRRKGRGTFNALLIDLLQNYAFRMAVSGELGEDRTYNAKAVEQYKIYHSIVRNPENGLWHQGRGWLEDKNALSPGAWSRGHGWTIRGMINVLTTLPTDSSEAQAMKDILEDMAQALMKVQLSSGMWPCLLDHDSKLSPPETSGTALIAGNIAIAVAEGWLPKVPYAAAARRAFAALPDYVQSDGTVLSVSPGPGPLWELEPWLVKSFPPGDQHGPFAIVFAALGEARLNAVK